MRGGGSSKHQGDPNGRDETPLPGSPAWRGLAPADGGTLARPAATGSAGNEGRRRCGQGGAQQCQGHGWQPDPGYGTSPHQQRREGKTKICAAPGRSGTGICC